MLASFYFVRHCVITAIETSLKWQLSTSRRDINCHWESMWAIQILFPFRITFIRSVRCDFSFGNSVRWLKTGAECALLPWREGCPCLSNKNVYFFFFLFLGIITVVVVIDINAYTGPARKISGLTDANSMFPGHITYLLSMLCVLRKTLSHAVAKRKIKRLKCLKFDTFICRLQVTSWQWRCSLSALTRWVILTWIRKWWHEN